MQTSVSVDIRTVIPQRVDSNDIPVGAWFLGELSVSGYKGLFVKIYNHTGTTIAWAEDMSKTWDYDVSVENYVQVEKVKIRTV